MKNYIEDVKYYVMDETITVCIIIDKYGFKHKGESFCADKESFSKELGEKYSKENAIKAMLPYYIFLDKYLDYENFVGDVNILKEKLEVSRETEKCSYTFTEAFEKVMSGDYSIRLDIWDDTYVAVLHEGKLKLSFVDCYDKVCYSEFHVSSNSLIGCKWSIELLPLEEDIYYKFHEAIAKVATGGYNMKLREWDNYHVSLENNILVMRPDCLSGDVIEWTPLASNISCNYWVIEEKKQQNK